jgi:hypothetical protein
VCVYVIYDGTSERCALCLLGVVLLGGIGGNQFAHLMKKTECKLNQCIKNIHNIRNGRKHARFSAKTKLIVTKKKRKGKCRYQFDLFNDELHCKIK